MVKRFILNKNMIKNLLMILIGLTLGGFICLGFIKYQIQNMPEPEYHQHADFALFISGEEFDFTKESFMSLEPCKVANSQFVSTAYAHSDNNEEDELRKNIHLHNGNGDVIHVHQEGMTYSQFFKSLGMIFTNDVFVDYNGTKYENNEDNEFRFFVNNQEVEDIANKKIQDLDRVLVTFGNKKRSLESIHAELIQVTNDACIFSEACPHKGDPGYELCGGVQEKVFLQDLLGIK